MAQSIKLEKVFGVNKDPILSYLERDRVDGLFVDSLKTDKQIIVYGSSKQGKSALVEKYLPYSDNILVSCSPKMAVEDIYKSILRQLEIGLVTDTQTKQTTSGELSIGARIKAIIPFLGSGETNLQAKAGVASEEMEKRETIEFNLSLAQDVSEIIKKVKNDKFIILENFHYLNENIQQSLSFDLRTFQEFGIRFIILGVWREKNRLCQFNGDLLDRVSEVPVEPWEKNEFRQVIEKGEKILNIKFHEDIITGIIENAFDSIGVVQELLKTTCLKAGIVQQQKETIYINNCNLLSDAIEIKTNEYSSRHVKALESIAEGRKASTPKDGVIPLYLPHYTVRAILTADFDSVLNGLRREHLETLIKEEHHRKDDVRPSDISNLLHNFAQLQFEKNIIPPIFDYDRTTRTMKVIDSTFYFFLRNVNKKQILENLINPVEGKEVSS